MHRKIYLQENIHVNSKFGKGVCLEAWLSTQLKVIYTRRILSGTITMSLRGRTVLCAFVLPELLCTAFECRNKFPLIDISQLNLSSMFRVHKN